MTDYIDRQAAIDMFNRLADDPWNVNTLTTWTKAFEQAVELIEELPTIEADIKCEDCKTIIALKAALEPVKHGKWKPFDLTWGRSVYACTSCGEAFEVPTEMGKPIFIYCPNCGAKMEVEEGVEE